MKLLKYKGYIGDIQGKRLANHILNNIFYFLIKLATDFSFLVRKESMTLEKLE